MNYRYLILFIIIILTGHINTATATFEDGFQNHPTDDILQGKDNIRWYETHAGTYPAPVLVASSFITHKNDCEFGAHTGHSEIVNDYGYFSSYWSFSVTHWWKQPTADIKVYFYDRNYIVINTYSITTWLPPQSTNVLDLYELVYSSGNIYLYKNGVLSTNLGALGGSEEPKYMGLYVNSPAFNPAKIRIAHASFDGNIISMCTDENPDTFVNVNSDDVINAFWSTKSIDPYGNWNDSTFQIVTTWLDASTTVNTTTITNKIKPIGWITYSRANIMPVPNYGTYKFDLTKDGSVIESDYLTFLPIGDSGTVSWNKATYVPYETGSATYQYSAYDPATYNYYLKTYNIDTGLKDTQTLTAITGTIDVPFNAWETGSYYSLLTVKDKATGDEYSFAFDTFDMADAVLISGITYDVTNNVSLGTTYINFTQNTVWYNTTSVANGSYELPSLSSSGQITANASKTNYTHEDFYFTPITASLYTVNLYLFPTNISRNTTAIEGMILTDTLHQAIPGATVNIWNSTWSNSTIANAMGYYRFDDLICDTDQVNETFNSSEFGTWVNLNNSNIVSGSQVVGNVTDIFYNNTDYEMNYTDSTINITASGNMSNYTDYYIDYDYYITTYYNLNATAPGHDDSTDYSVAVTYNNWSIQNILLTPIYTLTISAIDSNTLGEILIFDANLGGTIYSTTNGTITTYLSYGLYSFTITASNYYPGYLNVIMSENKNETITLYQVDSEYYAPHYVKFIVKKIWGTVYNNVTVDVYTGTSAIGISQLNGTTGTDGAVTFKLYENTQYTLTFISAEYGINKQLTLYPIDSLYYIFVSATDDPWTEFDTPISEGININVTKEKINLTHAYINVSYTDYLSGTTGTLVYLNQTNQSNRTGPQNITDSYNAGAGNFTHSFIVENYKGQGYFVHFIGSHTIYGNIDVTYTVHFPTTIGFFGIPDKAWLYFAVLIMIFTGAIFTARSAEQGALLVCFEGWIFMFFGWFNTVNELQVTAGLILATVVAVAANFIRFEKKEGLN